MTDQNQDGARIIDLTNVRRIPRQQQDDDMLDFLGALGDGHTGTDDCPKCAELKAEFGLDVTVARNQRDGKTLFFDVSEQVNPLIMAQILNAFFTAPVPQRKQSWMERNARWIIVVWLTLMGVLVVLGGIVMSLR